MSDASARHVIHSAVWHEPRATLERFAERIRADLLPAVRQSGPAALDAARRFVRAEQRLGHFYDADGHAIQFIGPFIEFQRAGRAVTEGQGVALNTFLTALGMYALVTWPEADVQRPDRQRRSVIECIEVFLGSIGISIPLEGTFVQAADTEKGPPTGFMGGAELAAALGIAPGRRKAFSKSLERERKNLGDNSYIENETPRTNQPRFYYRADSPLVLQIAERYRSP